MNENCCNNCNDIYDILAFILNNSVWFNDKKLFIDMALEKAIKGNFKLLKMINYHNDRSLMLRQMFENLSTRRIIFILREMTIRLFGHKKNLKYYLENQIAYPHPPPSGVSLEAKRKMREVLDEFFDDDPNIDLDEVF